MCVYRDYDDTDTGTDILPRGGGGGKELCMYVCKYVMGCVYIEIMMILTLVLIYYLGVGVEGRNCVCMFVSIYWDVCI